MIAKLSRLWLAGLEGPNSEEEGRMMKEFTETKTERVCVTDLRIGMFISKLDRPWIETSFPLEGLLLESQEDLERIEHVCNFVYIDRTQSSHVAAIPLSTASIVNIRSRPVSKSEESTSVRHRLTKLNVGNDGWKKNHCRNSYENMTSFNKEVKVAEQVVSEIGIELTSVLSNIRKNQQPDYSRLSQRVGLLVESVIRNPDASGWLAKIHRCHNDIFRHCIRLAIWACIFGREVGLEKVEVRKIASALLLTGIGKSQLAEDVLARYSFTEPSEEYQKHIAITCDEVARFKNIDQDVIDILANYTERHNGSGYPAQRMGIQIPFGARVAGMIEEFELQLNPYCGKGHLTPANAISNLFKVKDVLFEAELVESFIQAVGIYPAGSLVELDDHSVAMVVSHDKNKRLQAQVAVLMDSQHRPLEKPVLIDLEKGVKKWRKVEHFAISKGICSASVPESLLYQAHEGLFKQQKSWLGLVS